MANAGEFASSKERCLRVLEWLSHRKTSIAQRYKLLSMIKFFLVFLFGFLVSRMTCMSTSLAEGTQAAHTQAQPASKPHPFATIEYLRNRYGKPNKATEDGVIHMVARDARGSPLPRLQRDRLGLALDHQEEKTQVQTPRASTFDAERQDGGTPASASKGHQQRWPAPVPPGTSSQLWSLQDPATCEGYFANGYNTRDHVLGSHMAPRPYAVQAYIRAAHSVVGHGGVVPGGAAAGMTANDAAQLRAMALRGGHKDAMHAAAAQQAVQESGHGTPVECLHNPRHPSSYCVLRHVALRPDLVHMSRGNESLADVQGRADAEELPVYQPGAVQVLVQAEGDTASPHLKAPQRSSTPLTASQKHAFAKVRTHMHTHACMGTRALHVHVALCARCVHCPVCAGESTKS